MKLQRNVVFILLPAVILAGCTASKNIDRFKKEMADNNTVHKQNLSDLEKADSIRAEKFKNGLLDNVSNQQLVKYIDSLRSVSIRHLRDDSIMFTKKVRHNNVEFYLMISERIAREALEQQNNVSFVNTLLATNTFTEFNMSSLFGPGKYVFAGNEKQPAISAFMPVIDSILSFTSKFPTRKLATTIVLLGFADAQPINPSSTLAATLMKKIGRQTEESAELNKELSRLRAGSVRQILNEIIAAKKAENFMYKFVSVDYIFQGRGEELPDEKISDYKTADERRRVVKVFWSVIPYL